MLSEAGLEKSERELLTYKWRDDEFDGRETSDFMEFRLVYEGSLKSSGNSARHVQEKHAIRKVFHKQLRELWLSSLVLQNIRTHVKQAGKLASLFYGEVGLTQLESLARQFDRCGYQFVPLVSTPFNLVCGLDILFLRRELPGDLILRGGDVDNRIKTLLDALRTPDNCSEVVGAPETDDEVPFFCLLESDSLVTSLNVTTDRLMKPIGDDQRQNDVLLIIKVDVRRTVPTLSNETFGT